MAMKLTFPGGKRVDAEYKGFTIRTDQSEHGGGEGSAPAPFDLFLASIGTCAAFYVLSFLEKRGMPLDGVYVELDTEKDPATRMISKISLTAHVPAEFPAKYESALIRSMDLCAVKKHVLQAPAFDVSVAIGD